MSDTELEAKVREVGGAVIIGFKEPSATDGVDERGRVLVSDAQVRAGKARIRSLGAVFSDAEEYKLIPAVIAKVPAGLVRELRALPFIDYVDPVVPGRRLQQDTSWNVRRVNAPAAWPLSIGAGVKVMYIDSGADWYHPDLQANFKVAGVCAGANSNTTADLTGHGTFVAGIIAAVNNTSYLIGVSHGIDLWAGKDGDAIPVPSATAACVEWARLSNIPIINISTGYPSATTALTDQIRGAYNQNGMLVVVSAGNNGGAVTYPATLDEAIAVSATDINDNLASFSNRGAKIELTAPGVDVWSTSLAVQGATCSGGGYISTCSGTSFSAPAVAAVAALVKARYPSWTNVQIRQRLQQSATDLGSPGRDQFFGYGLVNAFAAVQ